MATLDKLTVINRALVGIGDAPVQLNDGSPGWQAADVEFGRVLDEFLATHPWPFARTSADLVQTSPNPSVVYAYAYALPPTLLHLRAVFAGGLQFDAFTILGRKLCCDQSQDVSIEYIRAPADNEWHPAATAVFTDLLEARLVGGYKGDENGGRLRHEAAMIKLMQVKALIDGENPSRNAFVGSASIARARRRG